MAGGHARAEAYRTGKRAKIVDRFDKPRWSDLWHGLDWIAQPHERGDFVLVQNAPLCRPYINYPFTRAGGHGFTDWRACDHIGGLQFTESEYGFASNVIASQPDFAVIEPNIDPSGNPNKQWPFDRWQTLVRLMPEINWVQLGPTGTRRLVGVRWINTGSFRLAAAVLARARFAVLPEGGLHHAAAVMGKRAVVLFGGAPSVWNTGYPSHDNIAADKPCGQWLPCPHCAQFWSALTPEALAEHVEALNT